MATILTSVELKLPERVTTAEFDQVVLKAIEQKISSDLIYDAIATRQLIKIVNSDIDQRFRTFKECVEYGVKHELYTPALLDFDYEKLDAAFEYNNDTLFNYFGAATLVDRYLIRDRSKKLMEKVQWMWMRIAM